MFRKKLAKGAAAETAGDKDDRAGAAKAGARQLRASSRARGWLNRVPAQAAQADRPNSAAPEVA
eukprot:gene2046-17741_t